MTDNAASPRRKPRRKPEDRWTNHFHDWLISPGGRLLRYAIVLVLMLVAVVGSLNRWFELCEVVNSATDGTTTTCSGPNITSAGVLAAVLLVLLLLWPDLSEFSAFGVTVKKLVLDVKQKVTENAATARRIDSRTTSTQASVDQLQSIVEIGDSRLTQQLDGITNSLGYLREQDYGNRSFESPPPALNRWHSDDQETLNLLGRKLFGLSKLDNRVDVIRDIASDRDFGPVTEALNFSAFSVVPLGLLVAMYRGLDASDVARQDELIDSRQASEVLRLVEKLILAYLEGRVHSLDAVHEATAVLWLIRERLNGK